MHFTLSRLILLPLLSLLIVLLSSSTLAHSPKVVATIAPNFERLNGADTSGRLLLYAPDPVELGSSISHWDRSAQPNLLMEPALSPDLAPLDVDISPALFYDIGWQEGNSTFNFISQNVPGTGLDDPTPFPGAPGNSASTLGEARTNVLNAVASAWGDVLDSDVPIDVLVTWAPLACGELGAVLGGARSTLIFRDDGSILPQPDTWYHAALAEALVGGDVTGINGDIEIVFNSDIDNECLAPDTGFYYGLDGAPPAGRLDFSPVVLHEIAHGLGFSNFTNEETGEFIEGSPGIYDWFTFDNSGNKTWVEMTVPERQASAINSGNVVWNGQNVTQQAPFVLQAGVPELTLNRPDEIADIYEVGIAAFGPSVADAPVFDKEVVCMVDEIAPITDGCSETVINLHGKIAFIDRGTCAFIEKVRNAEDAGAIAAIIVNNAGDDANNLGGSDPSIQIPAISIGQSDGERIRAELDCTLPPPIPLLSPMTLILLIGLLLLFALFYSLRFSPLR